MASDNRDWYRDWWRKKSGYVERADFRVPESQRQRRKQRAAWRSALLKLSLLLLLAVAAVIGKRFLL